MGVWDLWASFAVLGTLLPDHSCGSVVGRALITKHNAIAGVRLTFRFTLDQHLHPVGEQGDVFVLTGQHVAEFFNGAGQMRDLLFELCVWLCHGPGIMRGRGRRQATWRFDCPSPRRMLD